MLVKAVGTPFYAHGMPTPWKKDGARVLHLNPAKRNSSKLALTDGGRCITDALTEAYHVINMGRGLAGETPVAPKGGARFHFELPGAVQGFQPQEEPTSRGIVRIENVAGHSERGTRSLALRYSHLAPGREARVATPTFIPPEAIEMHGYQLLASPTLYSGQTVVAGVEADATNKETVTGCLYLQRYGADNALVTVQGPEVELAPRSRHELAWSIPGTGGQPIAAIGLALRSLRPTDGTVYLDYLTWQGAPDVVLGQPEDGGLMWRRAWVDAVDQWEPWYKDAYRLIKNHGTGLLMQGTRDWVDYRVTATITPYLAKALGIAARVQGLRRYYALLLQENQMIRLVKVLDGETVLAETEASFWPDTPCTLSLQVQGRHLMVWHDGQLLFEVDDLEHPLAGGGVAYVVTEGYVKSSSMIVQPVK